MVEVTMAEHERQSILSLEKKQLQAGTQIGPGLCHCKYYLVHSYTMTGLNR